MEAAPSRINPALPLSAAVFLPALLLIPIHMNQMATRKRLQTESASLKSELERDAKTSLEPNWDDPPLDPAWPAPESSLVRQIEAADGTLAERFAFPGSVGDRFVVFIDEEPATAAGRKVREVLLVSGYSNGKYTVEPV